MPFLYELKWQDEKRLFHIYQLHVAIVDVCGSVAGISASLLSLDSRNDLVTIFTWLETIHQPAFTLIY